jgi:hypothetical protein
MEGVMSRIRIAAAGAALLLLSGLTAGGAAAQTATNEPPGQPLQLLRLLHFGAPSHEAKVKPRARLLAKSVTKPTAKSGAKRLALSATALEKQAPAQANTTAALPPASIWPAVNAVPPIGFAAAEPAASATSTPGEPGPSEIVVAGQTVKVASPDDVNEIDLAANDEAATQAGSGSPSAGATGASANADDTAVKQKSDFVRAASAPRGEVGGTSWLLQVLAALGGAVAAGSMAWFLIGSTPQRTYG